MAYRSRYINKHVQFGEVNYSLILEDLETGMPSVRIEKTFRINPDLIDDNFLAEQANIEILNAIQAYNDAQLLQTDDNSGDS